MLHFENVSLCYGKKEILHDVNAKIEKEKLTVLVGKNGSGKSSLLSALIGQVPFSGLILLDGTPLSQITPRERAKRISLMPQILPETAFTVEQLVYLGRNPYVSLGAAYTQSDHAAVKQALHLANIGHLCDCSVSRLSGGERRLAFLAMTLAQDTELLLFDEPTAHLDAQHTVRFLQCVQNLVKEHGKTALLVLHDLTTAVSVADRFVCLDEQKCVFSGTKEDFLQKNIVQSVFGLHKTDVTDEKGNTRTVFYNG